MPNLKPRSKRINSKKDNPILIVNAFAVLFPVPLFFPSENKAVNKLIIMSNKNITMINLINIVIRPIIEFSYYAARKFNLQF